MLSQRSKRACSEDASEYLSTVRQNVSVRAVRAKLFKQAEPKLWDTIPDSVSGIRLQPSKDGTARLPKCRAIDYGEGDHSVHGSVLSAARKVVLKRPPVHNKFTSYLISDGFVASTAYKLLTAIHFCGLESIDEKFFERCRLTRYTRAKAMISKHWTRLKTLPCLTTDLEFQDKRQLFVHLLNGPNFSVTSYLLGRLSRVYSSSLANSALKVLPELDLQEPFREFASSWSLDGQAFMSLLESVTVADCAVLLRNLLRPGGSEDAYAVQCSQLRMATMRDLLCSRRGLTDSCRRSCLVCAQDKAL